MLYGKHPKGGMFDERIGSTATGTGTIYQHRDKGVDTVLDSRCTLKRYQRLSEETEAWLGGKMLNDALLANIR